jgi:hypothetical protein
MIPLTPALTASSVVILNANPDNDKNDTALRHPLNVIRVTEVPDGKRRAD